MATMDYQAYPDPQALPESQDLAETLQLNMTHPNQAVNPDHRVSWDQEALQDPLDPLVLKVSKELQERMVNPVRLVP